MKRILTDQAGSFAGSLAEAGVLHGDTARVTVTVGSPANPGGPLQTFCSSVVTNRGVITPGTPAEHALPITGEIEFVGVEDLVRAIEALDCNASEYGAWHTYDAVVHTNGCIQVRPDPASLKVHPARRTDCLNTSDGKPRARQIQRECAVA